jgi:hypothetical protein
MMQVDKLCLQNLLAANAEVSPIGKHLEVDTEAPPSGSILH